MLLAMWCRSTRDGYSFQAPVSAQPCATSAFRIECCRFAKSAAVAKCSTRSTASGTRTRSSYSPVARCKTSRVVRRPSRSNHQSIVENYQAQFTRRSVGQCPTLCRLNSDGIRLIHSVTDSPTGLREVPDMRPKSCDPRSRPSEHFSPRNPHNASDGCDSAKRSVASPD